MGTQGQNFPFHFAPVSTPSIARRAFVARRVRAAATALKIGHDSTKVALKVAQDAFLLNGDDVDAVTAGIRHAVAADLAREGRTPTQWPGATMDRLLRMGATAGLVAVALGAAYVAAFLLGWAA